ncbi:MAG: hypothetical protein HY465_04815 [Deltaproteobacteria bacterium]|nr:hypothetical protein [Deltaproteobacteria bacterium]
MKRWKQGHNGWTYIELVVAMTLTAVIVLSLGKIALLMIDAHEVETMARGMRGEASEASYRFSREARSVRDDTSVTTASSQEFRFIDVNGRDIRYWLSGTNLKRNADTLVEQITGLTLTYYDTNGVAIVAPLVSPSATNIRSVRMVLTVTRQGESFDVQTRAKLRNVH